MLEGWQASGYGYADYPHQHRYGISAVRPIAMIRLLADRGLLPIMFQAAQWDYHQDVHACRADW